MNTLRHKPYKGQELRVPGWKYVVHKVTEKDVLVYITFFKGTNQPILYTLSYDEWNDESEGITPVWNVNNIKQTIKRGLSKRNRI